MKFQNKKINFTKFKQKYLKFKKFTTNYMKFQNKTIRSTPAGALLVIGDIHRPFGAFFGLSPGDWGMDSRINTVFKKL